MTSKPCINGHCKPLQPEVASVEGRLREEIAAGDARLREGIAALGVELRGEAADTKRYMGVLAEGLRYELQLVAEAVQLQNERLTEIRREVEVQARETQALFRLSFCRPRLGRLSPNWFACRHQTYDKGKDKAITVPKPMGGFEHEPFDLPSLLIGEFRHQGLHRCRDV